MTTLKNSHKNHKLNYFLFTKTQFNKFLENGSKCVTTFDITTHRLLAKNAHSSEVHRRRLPNNTLDDAYNYKLVNDKGNNITYQRLKQDKSNNMDKFLKSYKSRHAKKNGLSKVDSYYENKIFKKIDNIYNLANNWNKDKKSFKKMILNKYGIYIFLILFPLLGLIFPVLFGEIFGSKPLFELCDKTETESEPCGKLHMTKTAQHSVFYINAVISLTIGIINIFAIVYILMKIIKYEKLKACKGKMNIKEYCRFCKGLFYNKKN
ncbi:Plasmodium exported protein, unknown function [Plasmodium vivax]|uniref:Variable surface protein Vir35 n=1 Tax=Plasmodium vivax TaxID=5855 RepID=A0A565A4K5_PLAVI|nr:Plasmodium exported protein, unknown function [Plasmodium vivax]